MFNLIAQIECSFACLRLVLLSTFNQSTISMIHSLSGADISQLPHTITFAPGGDSFARTRIPITNDEINEQKEVFVLRLEARGQALVDFSTREVAYCKITDDDGESQTFSGLLITVNLIHNVYIHAELIVGFERSSYTFSEDEGHITSISVVKFNNRETEQNMTIRAKAFVTGDGLELGSDVNFDLNLIHSGEFVYDVFPPEEQSKAISFSINDDVIPERLESLRLAAYVDGFQTSCSIIDGCYRVAEITIIDNDGMF